MNKKTSTNPRGAGRKKIGRKNINLRLLENIFPFLTAGAKDGGFDTVNQFAASIIEDKFKELIDDNLRNNK